MMTDIWCFTCNHELARVLPGGYRHVDADDEQRCVCVSDDETCVP